MRSSSTLAAVRRQLSLSSAIVAMAGITAVAFAQNPTSVSVTPGTGLVAIKPTTPGVPASLKGVKLDPEVPYIPGASIGPLGPIDSPDADADYLALRRIFGPLWTVTVPILH